MVSTCSDNGEGFSIRGTHSQSGFHYPDNRLQKPALHDQPRSCHNILSFCNALWIELEIPFDRQHMAIAFTSNTILITLFSGLPHPEHFTRKNGRIRSWHNAGNYPSIHTGSKNPVGWTRARAGGLRAESKFDKFQFHVISLISNFARLSVCPSRLSRLDRKVIRIQLRQTDGRTDADGRSERRRASEARG